MSEPQPCSVLVVGAGPVGCVLAILLRRQGLEVDLVERAAESAAGGSGHSFNLTLTSRGLDRLPHALKRRLYLQGRVLNKRIIHHRDGAISTQPYGTTQAHHLLSIPRGLLQDTLREQALRAGARIHYEQECVDVDTARPAALVRDRSGHTRWLTGDLLIGCDGANSAVRDAIANVEPERLQVSRRFIAHGHAEVTMDYADADPTGLHLWPRGDHFLQAMPNRDQSFTTSLFKSTSGVGGERHFVGLGSADAVSSYCATEFSDVFGRMSEVGERLMARPPGRLRVISCLPYHHRRAILIGDAAHVVVPFFGQGINCSFEDAATLAGLLDKFQFTSTSGNTAVAGMVAEAYSEARVSAGHALAELSLRNLDELSNQVDSADFLARRALERRLHELYPELYVPLYQLVAFTTVPYDEARRLHRESTETLDRICAGRDLWYERDAIIEEYVRFYGGAPAPQSSRAR